MSTLEVAVLVVSGLSGIAGLLNKLGADPAIRRLLKRIKLTQALLIDTAGLLAIALLLTLVHTAVGRYLDRTLDPSSPLSLLNQDTQALTIAMVAILAAGIVVQQIVVIKRMVDETPDEKRSPPTE